MPGRHQIALTAVLSAVVAVGAAQQALPSHTLLGRVSDTSDRALAGVTVELANPAADNSLRTVTTDADGRYRIDEVLPGVYVLTLRLQGFGSAIRDIEIGGGGQEFEYDVQLNPSTPGTRPAPPPSQPSRRVVCGMTLITPRQGIDPGIVAPSPNPPPANPVKPTIRAIQPTLCWESSSDSLQVPPKR